MPLSERERESKRTRVCPERRTLPFFHQSNIVCPQKAETKNSFKSPMIISPAKPGTSGRVVQRAPPRALPLPPGWDCPSFASGRLLLAMEQGHTKNINDLQNFMNESSEEQSAHQREDTQHLSDNAVAAGALALTHLHSRSYCWALALWCLRSLIFWPLIFFLGELTLLTVNNSRLQNIPTE